MTTRSIFELATDAGLNKIASMMRARAVKKERFSKIVVSMDDLIGVRLFSTGSFEQTQIDGVRDFIQQENYGPDAVFLDVGANIGVYSIALSQYFNEQFAFEANPVTHRILEANILLSRSLNTRCVNMAVSDTSGDALVYVPENGNLGWATLNADHHDIPVTSIEIKCDTLDNLARDLGIDIGRVKLIKIDVEGHEFNVIKGAEQLLRQARPSLLCEVLSSSYGAPLIDLLIDIGYDEFYTFKRNDFSNPFRIPVTKEKIDIKTIGHNALILAKYSGA